MVHFEVDNHNSKNPAFSLPRETFFFVFTQNPTNPRRKITFGLLKIKKHRIPGEIDRFLIEMKEGGIQFAPISIAKSYLDNFPTLFQEKIKSGESKYFGFKIHFDWKGDMVWSDTWESIMRDNLEEPVFIHMDSDSLEKPPRLSVLSAHDLPLKIPQKKNESIVLKGLDDLYVVIYTESNFVCRICGHEEYYHLSKELKIPHSQFSGRFEAGYGCGSCTVHFSNPKKFSKQTEE